MCFSDSDTQVAVPARGLQAPVNLASYQAGDFSLCQWLEAEGRTHSRSPQRLRVNLNFNLMQSL